MIYLFLHILKFQIELNKILIASYIMITLEKVDIYDIRITFLVGVFFLYKIGRLILYYK